MSETSVATDNRASKPHRRRWLIVGGAVAIFALGGVAGGLIVDHNENHKSKSGSASARARFVLAAEERVQANKAQLLRRVQERDKEQGEVHIRQVAYQHLSRAAQSRLDAYTAVVFRISGITVDGRTLAISISAHPPRLRQSSLMPIWQAGEISDATLSACAVMASDVATAPVRQLIARMSETMGAAESTFAEFAHHADSYSGSTYAATVRRWVSQQQAATTAFSAFQNRAT